MREKRKRKLSPANLEIMKIIWDKGEVTINDVVHALNATRTDKLRRTTVQVQMSRLEEYGWLKHKKKGRTHIYFSIVGKQKTRREILKDVTQRVFGGSRAELVKCLLEDSDVSPEDLEELRNLLDNS